MFLQAKLISKEVQPLYKVSDDMLENGNILRLVNNENIIKRHKVDILSSDDGVFYVPSLGRDIKIVIGTNSGLIDGHDSECHRAGIMQNTKQYSGIIAWFAQNHVAANLLMIFSY